MHKLLNDIGRDEHINNRAHTITYNYYLNEQHSFIGGGGELREMHILDTLTSTPLIKLLTEMLKILVQCRQTIEIHVLGLMVYFPLKGFKK